MMKFSGSSPSSNPSLAWVAFLTQAGFECVHWSSVGSPRAPDAELIVAQREIQVFQGFEAADRVDDEYYAALAPQERFEILLDLVAPSRASTGEGSARLERVCRVTDSHQIEFLVVGGHAVKPGNVVQFGRRPIGSACRSLSRAWNSRMPGRCACKRNSTASRSAFSVGSH